MTDSSTQANRLYDGMHPHGIPMERFSSAPHLVGGEGGCRVKVAAVAVINASGQILVGHNKKRFCWDIPQGVVENGELPIETAVRELLEETGLQAQPEDLQSIALFRHQTPEFVFPWETTLYIAHLADVRGAYNAEPEKCYDMHWFAPVQLPNPRGLSLRVLLNLLGRE